MAKNKSWILDVKKKKKFMNVHDLYWKSNKNLWLYMEKKQKKKK